MDKNKRFIMNRAAEICRSNLLISNVLTTVCSHSLPMTMVTQTAASHAASHRSLGFNSAHTEDFTV